MLLNRGLDTLKSYVLNPVNHVAKILILSQVNCKKALKFQRVQCDVKLLQREY